MKHRKKVLIAGASLLQLPAILKAKEMGCYTAVIDLNPQAIGIPYADEFYCISTIDVEGVTDVAKRFKPDGIITLATDMPMRAIAKACEICSLPGISYNTAVRATDKEEMIKAFEQAGVEHPWYCVASDMKELLQLREKISYPCVMKPTDNAGSRGVILCCGWDDVTSNYGYAYQESRKGKVILEEFLQGPEFSVEIMVVDGKPYVLQVTDKLTTGAPHFVEMGHSQPTVQPEIQRSKIENIACRAVKSVGIECGPAHVEVILTQDGPKMVELGARMGGDCITTHLVPLSTGIDMIKATIDIACGNTPDITSKFDCGSAIRYFNTPEGRITDISKDEEARKIEGITEITFMHKIGENLTRIKSSIDRTGFVIAQAETAEEAVNRCMRAINTIKIEVE